MTWPDIGWYGIAVCSISLAIGLGFLARRIHREHRSARDGSSTEHVPIRIR